MADIKDILGMSRGGGAGEGGSSRAVKEKMQRPQGMSREAFALLGGSHPIMTSQIASELKKKSDLQVGFSQGTHILIILDDAIRRVEKYYMQGGRGPSSCNIEGCLAHLQPHGQRHTV